MSVASAQTVTVGPNVRASDKLNVPFVENSIAVDPTNPQNIIISSDVADTGNTSYPNGALEACILTSNDGGSTWTRRLSYGFTNAAVTWGADGTGYFTAIAHGGNTQLFTSSDHGVTWANNYSITGAGDYPTIACDTVSSLYNGKLYSSVGGGGFNIFTSTNKGANFSQASQPGTPSGVYDFASQFAFYPDGTALFSLQMDRTSLNSGSYFDVGTGIRFSTDGGATFSGETAVLDAGVTQYAVPANGTVVPQGGSWAMDYNLAVAPDGSRAYFACTDARTIGQYRILFNYSDNKGTTTSTPIQVSPNSSTSAQYNCRLAVNKYGVVGLIWFDTRQTSNLSAYDLYFAYSTDKGQTFSAPVRVSTKSSTPKFSNQSSSNPSVDATYRWLPGFDDLRFVTGGDHIGLTTDSNGNFLAAWPDGRSDYGGIQQTLLSRIQVSGATLTLASAVSRFVAGGKNFDLPLALTGNPTIEDRIASAPGSYQLILTFSTPVSAANAVLQLQPGQSGSVVGSASPTTISGSTVTVSLTGVGNAQRLNLHFCGVQPGNRTFDVPFNVLHGDVNGDGAVNILDLGQVRLQSGLPVTSANLRDDINGDGAINILDQGQARSFSGTSLP